MACCLPQSVILKQDKKILGACITPVLILAKPESPYLHLGSDRTPSGTNLNLAESIFCARKPGGRGGTLSDLNLPIPLLDILIQQPLISQR